ERLLGISWQDFSISVVVETTQGQRQIDVFRPDNVYDLWVRMYLRRDNRALSDFPREICDPNGTLCMAGVNKTLCDSLLIGNDNCSGTDAELGNGKGIRSAKVEP